jgi:hypothetical protein
MVFFFASLPKYFLFLQIHRKSTFPFPKYFTFESLFERTKLSAEENASSSTDE